MNKILSKMMLACTAAITPQQVDTLQTFKDTPADFDHSQPDYNSLLNFNLDLFKVDETLPEDKQKGPVDMSPEEFNMQTIVEVSFIFQEQG